MMKDYERIDADDATDQATRARNWVGSIIWHKAPGWLDDTEATRNGPVRYVIAAAVNAMSSVFPMMTFADLLNPDDLEQNTDIESFDTGEALGEFVAAVRWHYALGAFSDRKPSSTVLTANNLRLSDAQIIFLVMRFDREVAPIWNPEWMDEPEATDETDAEATHAA